MVSGTDSLWLGVHSLTAFCSLSPSPAELSAHTLYHRWFQTSNQKQCVTPTEYNLTACEHHFHNCSTCGYCQEEDFESRVCNIEGEAGLQRLYSTVGSLGRDPVKPVSF